MKSRYNSRQILAGLTFGFLIMTGTYNAIVINSESILTGADVRFAKRLDEVYGVVVSKREVATTISWQKLSIKQAAILKAKNVISDKMLQQTASAEVAPQQVEVRAEAAVKEELNLNLTAVVNPSKWPEGIKEPFSGSLSTNQGVIESLNISLPKGESISVSFSEMTGNVFEYDYEGELYSGMMYQENENSYVVTLTTGPDLLKLAGTRLTFTGEPSPEIAAQAEENQRLAAETTEADAGAQQELAQAPEQQMTDEQASAQQTADQLAAEQGIQPTQQDIVQTENLQAQDIYAQEQGQLDQAVQQGEGYNFEQTQAAM